MVPDMGETTLFHLPFWSVCERAADLQAFTSLCVWANPSAVVRLQMFAHCLRCLVCMAISGIDFSKGPKRTAISDVLQGWTPMMPADCAAALVALARCAGDAVETVWA